MRPIPRERRLVPTASPIYLLAGVSVASPRMGHSTLVEEEEAVGAAKTKQEQYHADWRPGQDT